MTRLCCPSCRLRFPRVSAAYLVSCPRCTQALEPIAAQDALGYQLFPEADPVHVLLRAIELRVRPPERES